ncbi:MAG: RNA methyltransferase [Flavobacteriales bacterium]|nr:RNA methyltransferase [Flavobacteriales bacterium]
MLLKSTIKFVRSLHQKKFRKSEGLFIVEGLKPVQELLASSLQVQDIFITESTLSSFDGENYSLASAKDMAQMSAMKSPPGIIAVAKTPQPIPAEKPDRPVLLLEDLSDPGNLGTILRTAEWFDAPYVMMTPQTVEPFSPKVVQAAMGSLFRLPLMQVTLEEIAEMGIPVFNMDMQGQPLQNHDFQAAIYAIGKESTGISSNLKEMATGAITIPGSGKTESLNASIAASVLLSQEFFNRIG